MITIYMIKGNLLSCFYFAYLIDLWLNSEPESFLEFELPETVLSNWNFIRLVLYF